jgi:hypothetical protein
MSVLELLDSRKQRGATDGFRGNQYTEVVKAPSGAISNTPVEQPTMALENPFPESFRPLLMRFSLTLACGVLQFGRLCEE